MTMETTRITRQVTTDVEFDAMCLELDREEVRKVLALYAIGQTDRVIVDHDVQEQTDYGGELISVSITLYSKPLDGA